MVSSLVPGPLFSSQLTRRAGTTMKKRLPGSVSSLVVTCTSQFDGFSTRTAWPFIVGAPTRRMENCECHQHRRAWVNLLGPRYFDSSTASHNAFAFLRKSFEHYIGTLISNYMAHSLSPWAKSYAKRYHCQLREMVHRPKCCIR
jgi:hypothetical protein